LLLYSNEVITGYTGCFTATAASSIVTAYTSAAAP